MPHAQRTLLIDKKKPYASMRLITPPNATPYICKCLLTAIMLAGSHCMASSQTVSEDSLYAISQVTVVGSKGRDIIPSQRLSGEQLQRLNTVSVAEIGRASCRERV